MVIVVWGIVVRVFGRVWAGVEDLTEENLIVVYFVMEGI
jgi:hypothetical protein